jgi:uncharacterized repeat protein (TIGR01451 family)
MALPARFRLVVPTTVLAVLAGLAVAVAPSAPSSPTADDTPVLLTPKGEIADEFHGADESSFDKLRDAYYWSRLLSGDDPISLTQAASLRSAAVKKAASIGQATSGPGSSRGSGWSGQGPNPIVQVGRTSNTFEAVAGRVGALAIRNDGTIILGAAQGGVWTYDTNTGTWTNRTSATDSQAVGALAIAPSNDSIVYMGSGEAALSGDSYYGDGFYRSTDGGVSWQHVSTLFTGQAVSDIAVDPNNPQHVYASTVRGRGGNHRTTSPTGAAYGVYESTNGGSSWTLLKGTTNELHGATDLVMDPQNPSVLFASFWGDGIYKSSDGGHTWALSMSGLPAGNFLEGGTRFSLGISDPAGAPAATLYTGFDYFDTTDHYHQARVYKSTDAGATWAPTAGTGTGTSSIVNYCGTQCFYDNEVKPDPTNPNVVFVLGSYGYNNSPQSGGVYRTTDGGATWKNLGYDLHPDMHAIAYQPTDTAHVAIGNDGGVWDTHTRGGRNGPTDPLSAADWQNLNGQVNPTTGSLIHSTGLAITQFTSMATVPNVPGQYWGGTQDNGTLRKSLANNRWFDQASGDGGQVIVDQTTPNPFNPNLPAYVFGTYTGTSIYRYDPSETGTFFGNEPIDGGIQHDRAEFYIPWVQNRGNVNQMFLGTYRVYRTDNAEAPGAGDVTWTPISPDLTSGCTGSAANGARGCFVSALGVADGGDGVYAGTDEGWIQVSPNAVTADSPTWTRVGVGTLPNRPVDQIAVDRSNWRVAYAAYGGFGPATPGNTGHVFATSDGGAHWSDISGNLPDTPVNSVVLDPSDANTLYVGTDVGAFVTTNRGQKWFALGSGMPKVAVWQLDLDSSHAVLAAGTHGRGAYTLPTGVTRRALVVSKADSGKPVGPDSTIDYTITVRNIGNAADTGVSVTDPVPAHTNVTSIGDGGYLGGNTVHWDNLTIPAGGSVDLHYSAHIAANLSSSVTAIVNDGIVVKDASGVATTGSPHTTPIAPPHAVTVTPASGREGAKVGQSASFIEHVTNDGYLTDTFNVSASGGAWNAAVFDASCTTPITVTPSVAAGDTTDVCVKVDVPAGATDNSTNDTTFTATSSADSSVTGTATLTTIAVAKDTLLVDEDLGGPDVQSYYEDALTTDGIDYSYWDLSADPAPPASYFAAHRNIVWFTGNAYPAPITPYESELATFLDGGGRLFMSGQDILDQAAGTTAFVQNYLHVDWDGSEAQNDKATAAVHGVAGNPVTNSIGTVLLDHSVLNAAFEDEITPIAPATAAFTDDSAAPDALTVADGAYKVAFLAFPFEAYGSAADKAALMNQAIVWLDS